MILLRMVWSIIAWTLAYATMAILCVLYFPPSLFIPFEKLQRYGPAQVLSLVPYLTLSRMTITHHPDFDPTRNTVFVMNHTSMLDAHIAIASIPQVFCGVENAAHLNIPFYGWLMRMANAIPVYPRSDGRTSEMIAAARDRAARNISILTFPEGHRTPDGLPRPYKRGAFFMARDASLPIVPICVRGFYKVLPKGPWIVNPGHIEVLVGAPMELDGLSDDEIAARAEQARAVTLDWIQNAGSTPAP